MNLRLDIYSLDEHAQVYMRKLNITYQHCTPQSIADQWWFWNCENVPNPLPKHLTELNVKPIEAIGFGLSEEDVKNIENYAKIHSL